jgi:LemA protein
MLIFIAIALGLGLYLITFYNGLVALKTRIKASIQEIGNQLKRQSELIPNLEVSAKSYLKHEKEIMTLLTDARKSVADAAASGDLSHLDAASSKVAQLLPKLQVVVESNPQLKGADVISKLMDELRDTSDKVMYSRRTLIDLTGDYNIKLGQFPGNLLASMFGFLPESGLKTPESGAHVEVTPADLQTPKVNL